MKRCKFIAIMLVVMMMFSTVFASAASDPAVTIVSPAVESVVNSDSLLISIKITKPETIRVSVPTPGAAGSVPTPLPCP